MTTGATRRILVAPAALILLTLGAAGQEPSKPPPKLPDGPGKEDFESVCSLCHSPAAPAGKQWTRAQWQAKVTEMLQEEPDVTTEERAAIVEYLSATFKPGGKIFVNLAGARDLQTLLAIPAAQADAVTKYRTDHGDFQTIADLKQVPGLDPARVDAKRDDLAF